MTVNAEVMNTGKYSLFDLLIEDDIILKILHPLDLVSLKHLELSSVLLWNFVKRTKIWKKKFQLAFPDFFENPLNSDIIQREKYDHQWDDHYKYKRLTLKLHYLESNWANKNYLKKCYNLTEKLGAQHQKLDYIDRNYLLSISPDSFFSTIHSLYDVNKLSVIKQFDPRPKFQVCSVHTNNQLLALFGEPQLDPGTNAESEYNFLIKVYSLDTFALLQQSVLLHEDDVTPWSQVRICDQHVVLFVSNIQGKDLNLQQDHEAVQMFKLSDSKFLEHRMKIVLELPVKKYLSMVDFSDKHIIGCRRRETVVEVWDLQAPTRTGDLMKAPLVWSRDISFGNLIKCTCVLLHYPEVFIGLSDGRCDIWDVQLNTRRRCLRHQVSPSRATFEAVGANHLIIKKVLVTEHYVLTLCNSGKIYIWDKHKILGLESSDYFINEPMWTCKSTNKRNKIVDCFAENTKIVTVENSDEESFLVTYDFWHSRSSFSSSFSLKRHSLHSSAGTSKTCKFC